MSGNDVGIKYDQDKLRFDLFPPEALFGVSRILTFGAAKYTPRNWERGLQYGRVFGAVMRHLWAWWHGEDNDPETGENHLHHAACCVAFLQTYVERGMTEFDDRPGRIYGGPNPLKKKQYDSKTEALIKEIENNPGHFGHQFLKPCPTFNGEPLVQDGGPIINDRRFASLEDIADPRDNPPKFNGEPIT